MAASRVWLVTLLIAAAWLHHSAGALRVGYYDSTCNSAESIVRGAVRSAVSSDRTIAASLVRLHFHDCFVQVKEPAASAALRQIVLVSH
jgi:peroxidase